MEHEVSTFTRQDGLASLTENQAEAERLMTICNACRYCEGLCAVFPAMELRRQFPAGDLNYLANLCHNCGACYYDCQFATPHEFAVNVPQVFAAVRYDSYANYAWPSFLSGAFASNGVLVSMVCALSVSVFLGAMMAFNDVNVMFGAHEGAGAFYRIMPHGAMVAIFGAALAYAILALAMGLRSFWCDTIHPAGRSSSFWQAVKDAGQLRYLDGGGEGCSNEEERPRDHRRLFHHMTFYGFGLCFAATSVATLYAYVFDWQAPYQFYDLPVVLGTVGGLGLLIGPAGFLFAKMKRDPSMVDKSRRGMDVGFIAMLFLTSLTGLLLLALRSTPAMGSILALHLGFVFGLFVTLPYSKFVHGLYRFAALMKFANEKHAMGPSAGH
jgi:citrate/tricarballylate utilization protein